MIPPRERPERLELNTILGTAEWVTARRSGDHFASRDRRDHARDGREESSKLVWSGALSVTRRGRDGASGRDETVDETAGAVKRAAHRESSGDHIEWDVVRRERTSEVDESAMEARKTRAPKGGARPETLDAFVKQQTITCQLVAQAPPASANIPGTARGEGFARASAAGSALPEIVHAACVSPGDEGWPEVWDPVALLRLFPLSAHHAAAFQEIQSVLSGDCTAVAGGEDAELWRASAARMDLPDGYVMFIVSDVGLPDVVFEAVGARTIAGSSKRTATEPKRSRPLWAIIQSVLPLAAPEPPAAVPTPDIKPARGILRGWTVPIVKEMNGEGDQNNASVLRAQMPEAVRMPEELSGVHAAAETTDDEKSLSSALEMTSSLDREGMGTVTPVTSEDTSELTSGTSDVDRVLIKIGDDDKLDDWLSPPLARRKRKSRANVGTTGSGGWGSDGENSDDSSGREFAKLKRTATSPTASPSSSEGEEELVQMEGQHEIPSSAAAIAAVISPEERVPNIPLPGLRFMLLGFELNHPHVVHLIESLGEEGAIYVGDPKPGDVDLVVVHPPFLQLLSAPQFPFHTSGFIRTRHTRFALGLRHLELCLEYKRQLDPRLETAEVFPEGVLVVMDDSALTEDEDALHRIVRLLAKAAAASAAAAAAKGIFHYGQDGTRENPPWPWAIKVANSTIQKLMLTKLRMMQGNPEKAWKIESMIKSLHAYKHAGDRAGRGTRVMGITWEEASHQPVEEPPQAVRDAVKIAARHVSMCRAVFLVSEDQRTLVAAKGHRSILSGTVHDACEFLTGLIREMWAETKAARTGMNVHDSNVRRRKRLSMTLSDQPSASEVNSEAGRSPERLEVEEEVTGDTPVNTTRMRRKKVVRFPTMIDDGGRSTRSRGRYSPPPSPTRTNSGRTGDDTSKDTSKTSTGDAPTDGEETQSPIVGFHRRRGARGSAAHQQL